MMTQGKALRITESLLLGLGDVGQQAHHVAGEAVLVVVPGDELHEVAVAALRALKMLAFFRPRRLFSIKFSGLKI